MAATGEPYSVAARAVQSGQPDHEPVGVIDPALLAPYPDEDDVEAAELGWRTLPADATPRDRARAEATWRPVHPGRPCRCIGSCKHGHPCPECATGDQLPAYPESSNWLVHVDRYPGSLFTPIIWEDDYQCAACGGTFSMTAELPTVPWAEPGATGGLVVFSGVRHPNFPEISPDTPEHPDGDGSCRSCGGYALYGLLCDGCRADGWTDFYGQVNEPDEDDDPNACPECGAGGRGDPYGECVCYEDLSV